MLKGASGGRTAAVRSIIMDFWCFEWYAPDRQRNFYPREPGQSIVFRKFSIASQHLEDKSEATFLLVFIETKVSENLGVSLL